MPRISSKNWAIPISKRGAWPRMNWPTGIGQDALKEIQPPLDAGPTDGDTQPHPGGKRCSNPSAQLTMVLVRSTAASGFSRRQYRARPKRGAVRRSARDEMDSADRCVCRLEHALGRHRCNCAPAKMPAPGPRPSIRGADSELPLVALAHSKSSAEDSKELATAAGGFAGLRDLLLGLGRSFTGSPRIAPC